jgi:low affinity Fe/Cu permease
MVKKRHHTSIRNSFEAFSKAVTRFAGSTPAFGLALGVVVVWAVTGPVFRFSNTWQLVINTGTTIVTFLMVFLIQRSQNKDALAVHLKLNEIVAALDGASNRLIDVEALSESDLETLHRHYHELAALAAKSFDIRKSHSVEEARQRHGRKEKRGSSAR